MDQHLPLPKFLQFLQDWGSTLNIASYLHEEASDYILDHDLNEECLAETDCVTSADLIQLLTGDEYYFKMIINHPNSVGKNRKYFSDQICDLLSNVQDPCLITIELGDVVEKGRHVLSIISFNDKCYLVQSYVERYTYDIVEYPRLSVLLNYFATMFDEVSDLKTKIFLYNKLTNNVATIDDYETTIAFSKRIHGIKPSINISNDEYQGGILFVMVSDFHLPLIDEMIMMIQKSYDRIKKMDYPRLKNNLLNALSFLQD